MLDGALWQSLSPLLDHALDLNADERAHLLGTLRLQSPDLASMLDELLQEHDRAAASGFLDETADPNALRSLATGQTVGAYTLERLLGAGGMGTVWLGRRHDGRFEGQVAVKLLNLALLDGLGQERFRREGTALARLSHPNIARLLDAGTSPSGQPYLVLEYIEGLPIDAFADDHLLTVADRINLMLDVLAGVAHAHANLIVHRDLKPSNILVTADGTPKLLDFGIARLLASEERDHLITLAADGRALTPEFAAPEQVRGEPSVVATDVYSVGVLLYVLLTGSRPYDFASRSAADIERTVCERVPAKPSATFDAGTMPADELSARARARGATPARLRRQLQGDLDTIVMKALRKEPERRYETVASLHDDLRRHLGGHPVLARPDNVVYRARKFVGRHRGGVAAAAVLVALIAGGGVRERTLRGRAEAETRKARAVEEYLVSIFDVANPFAPPGVRGNDVTARALLDRGAARVAGLSAQPEVQAELRAVLGNVYVNLGLLETAEPLLRAALDQQRALHGSTHPGVAAAMGQLGDLLRLRSRFDEAEPLLREALQQRRDLLGNAHPDTSQSLDQLGTLLQERSQYDAAESLFREAIEGRRAIYGSDHEHLAQSLNNLAVLLYLKARDPRAENLYREALAIQIHRLGQDHPSTAQTEQNLAQVLEEFGRLDEAEALYRRALAAKRKTLGDAHPSVTVNLNNFANFLAVEQGRLDEADSLAREALSLDRRMFKEPHAYIAESLRRVGTILRLKGDLDNASQQLGQALAMNRALFGAEHLRIASNLNQIALTRQAQGDLAGAIPLFRESLAQYRRLVGEHHIAFRTLNNNLARALREHGEPVEAEAMLRASLDRFDLTSRAERGEFVAALTGIGLALIDQQKASEALPLLERAVAMSRERFGATHWRTGDAQLALGTALMASGQQGRAQPVLREALTIIEPQRRALPRLAEQAGLAVAQLRR